MGGPNIVMDCSWTNPPLIVIIKKKKGGKVLTFGCEPLMSH